MTAMSAVTRDSFDHSPLGFFDEAYQHGHVLPLVAFGFDLFQGLRSVQLGIEKNAEGMMDFGNPFLAEPAAFQAYSVEPIGAGLARGHHLCEGQNVFGDDGAPTDVRM